MTHTQRNRIARSGDIRRGRRDEDEGMRRKGLIEKEMYGGGGRDRNEEEWSSKIQECIAAFDLGASFVL